MALCLLALWVRISHDPPSGWYLVLSLIAFGFWVLAMVLLPQRSRGPGSESEHHEAH
jgi:hypothetical protein